MATFTDVFERKEVKYRLTRTQYLAMVASPDGLMEIDSYGATLITSLYFDTPNRSLIDRSLEKPEYKEKLRLRSYGVPTEEDRVYVENLEEVRRDRVQAPRRNVVCGSTRLFRRGIV